MSTPNVDHNFSKKHDRAPWHRGWPRLHSVNQPMANECGNSPMPSIVIYDNVNIWYSPSWLNRIWESQHSNDATQAVGHTPDSRLLQGGPRAADLAQVPRHRGPPQNRDWRIFQIWRQISVRGGTNPIPGRPWPPAPEHYRFHPPSRPWTNCLSLITSHCHAVQIGSWGSPLSDMHCATSSLGQSLDNPKLVPTG